MTEVENLFASISSTKISRSRETRTPADSTLPPPLPSTVKICAKGWEVSTCRRYCENKPRTNINRYFFASWTWFIITLVAIARAHARWNSIINKRKWRLLANGILWNARSCLTASFSFLLTHPVCVLPDTYVGGRKSNKCFLVNITNLQKFHLSPSNLCPSGSTKIPHVPVSLIRSQSAREMSRVLNTEWVHHTILRLDECLYDDQTSIKDLSFGKMSAVQPID